jgi:hypothetical protein
MLSNLEFIVFCGIEDAFYQYLINDIFIIPHGSSAGNNVHIDRRVHAECVIHS